MGLRHPAVARAALLLGVLAAVPAAAAAADPIAYTEPNGAACAQAIRDLKLEAAVPEPPGGLPCRTLAIYLYSAISADAQPRVVPVPKAVINPYPDLGGTQGAAGQATGVTSTQPTPDAGGTVAVAGTPTGPQLLTEVRFNPFSLVASKIARPQARLMRFSDVSILIPVTTKTAADIASMQYLGLRMRLNLSGIGAGNAVYDAAQAAAVELQQDSGVMIKALRDALEKTRDPKVCAESIIRKADAANVQKLCGALLETTELAGAEERFRKAVEAVRKEADSKYWGLDLRADFGDPTFSGEPEKRGTYLAATLAGGTAHVVDDRYLQVRGRFGVTYASIRSLGSTSVSVDWAAGFELGIFGETQKLKGGFGLEGRHTTRSAEGDTNFIVLHLGLTVPATDNSALSVGVALPIAGRRPPLVTMSGDWSLLLKR